MIKDMLWPYKRKRLKRNSSTWEKLRAINEYKELLIYFSSREQVLKFLNSWYLEPIKLCGDIDKYAKEYHRIHSLGMIDLYYELILVLDSLRPQCIGKNLINFHL